MQQKWWIIQQPLCHNRLLLGFVCPAMTCQNKDSPPGDGKLPWTSACCCIVSVAFDWAIWLLLAGLLQMILAGCHGITDPLRGRHQGMWVWALARFYLILHKCKWYIIILTPKSGEVMYWLIHDPAEVTWKSSPSPF